MSPGSAPREDEHSVERSDTDGDRVRGKDCAVPTKHKELAHPITVEDLFSIDTLQTLQDQFAQATGVASVITQPDGTPITRPSNFCRLCESVIRRTEKGRSNCFHSDSVIGRHNPDGPIIQQCLSGGLWDAGASITVGGRHIANWLIGQVRNDAQDDESMRQYAREIGADEEAFLEAFHEVPSMSLEKFQQVSQVLFTLAEQLSSSAYQNIVQARFIEERNRTEAVRLENEARLKAVLEGSQLGFWDWDMRSGTVQRNERWADMLGYTLPDMRRSVDQWAELIHPDDRDRTLSALQRHIEGHSPRYFCEYRLRAHDGSYRWILDQARIVAHDAEGRPIRMSGTHADITERKQADLAQLKLDNQRHRQQKLEGMVKLAGGVAHDFNNLLQALMGSIDLVLPELPDSSPAKADVADMLHLCQRMAMLSRQMQVCSGGLVFAPQPLDLNQLIINAQPELKQCIQDGVTLSFDLVNDLPLVRGDEALLRQALRNLTVNASEAMADSGCVTLRTGTLVLDSAKLAHAVFCNDVSAGEYVALDILDTGCGMAPETLQRLFDPFFTTKPKGRGLGLAEVMGIMRAHQGAIFVNSQIGHGTSIRLAWPCLPSIAQAPDSSTGSPPAVQPPSPAASNTILVVDDEPCVLTTTQRFLAMSGYRVLTATDGKEGVAAFRKEASTIDLVLLDLTMPKMDGVQAFREIRHVRPDVPVIIASGYSEQDTLNRFGADQPSGFLQKPYKRDTLLKHVSTWVKSGRR